MNLDLKLSSGWAITGNDTPNMMPERNPRGRLVSSLAMLRLIERNFSSVEHLAPNTDLLCKVDETLLKINYQSLCHLQTLNKAQPKQISHPPSDKIEPQDSEMKISKIKNQIICGSNCN